MADAWIVQGMSDREIGRRIGTSSTTVRKHRLQAGKARELAKGRGDLLAIQTGRKVAKVREVAVDILEEFTELLHEVRGIKAKLKEAGPVALPGILASIEQARKLLESMLRAKVIEDGLTNGGAKDTPQQRAAEVRAFLDLLLSRLSPAAKEEVLKAISDMEPA